MVALIVNRLTKLGTPFFLSYLKMTTFTTAKQDFPLVKWMIRMVNVTSRMLFI